MSPESRGPPMRNNSVLLPPLELRARLSSRASSKRSYACVELKPPKTKPMGGDDPVAPPRLGEVIDTLKELAYHAAGAGAPESHRARLYTAALAFLQILHGDGQTLRCVDVAWKIRGGDFVCLDSLATLVDLECSNHSFVCSIFFHATHLSL